MTDSTDDEFDPTAAEQREIGREMVEESTGLGSVMAHGYRGELGRVDTWRQRLDQTTTWAVTVMAAILTWAFSSPDNPHYILLIAIIILTVFLGIEARRYRDYDVFRSRVRLIQENLFANALDPSQGIERADWRAELSRDYREPTVKVTMQEALAHRLRRVYLALLGILLVAWLFRVTAFAPREDWIETAAIANIPGIPVIGAVSLFYVVLVVIALWPRERQAKGEFRKGTNRDWKRTDREDESTDR
ncbi:DUF2270 domain-containing protein [Halostagnicola kamekurae]|uniref:Uncharacterized membrane protein n=1 Tax=Halostagnicola kamekurae TaxID=619731 RepID=A0A1I6TVQ1_9EURY|nr:DUF2270 domain-containing protein [Halostagnicola kamekurae]SFS93312.1 Uncharacterized membrane protein [Halostagnicola kamekurae]